MTDLNPSPELPIIARYYFQPGKVDEYCNVMSDVLCWLQGFQAGGGKYHPGTIEILRNLNDGLKSIQAEQSKSETAHTKRKSK